MKDTTKHYNEAYYEEHYQHVLGNDAYYGLLSSYWTKSIFEPLLPYARFNDSSVLDYGCGTGVVSAAMKNVTCFDTSECARKLLKDRGRTVYERAEDIPKGSFDAVLCSHSLEHYPNPMEELKAFRNYVREDGYLVLVLPVEVDTEVLLMPDNNQHLYCWTFQTISNLLHLCGWKPMFGEKIYGPFLLGTLGHMIPDQTAVLLAHKLGKLRGILPTKGGFPSMLVLAQKVDDVTTS